MKAFEEKACLCALNRIFGFEPKVALALISHLGSASEIFRVSHKDMDLLLGPYSKYRNMIHERVVEESSAELEKLEEKGIRFLGWTEESYPALLKDCEDAPVGLYIRSDSPDEALWKPSRRIAIVGTRDVSLYGREWCERIVVALSRCKERPVIVSGLALGTDACAHQTALKCGLGTIGVMATGPDSIYPYRNREIAENMSRTEGCALITDYPPGTAPLAIHFLRRNRIIAGLCEATILIESKVKGGGMMTARLASSYNREVYALPGRVDDIRSQGCNHLIRSKTAEPLTCAEDILESLGYTASVSAGNPSYQDTLCCFYGKRHTTETISLMVKMICHIRQHRGITLEDLATACGAEYRTTLQLAGVLEADGFINIDLMQRCTINNIKI